jgi:hypothetical protein
MSLLFPKPSTPLGSIRNSNFFQSSSSNSSSSNLLGSTSSTISSIALQLGLFIILAIVLIIVVNIVKNIYLNYKINKLTNVKLINGTVNSRKQQIHISQDPTDSTYIPIARSMNKQNGIEFTYMLWMFIDDWNYKAGAWKHVMHKGNSLAWPTRCPGIWIAENTNDLYIYINTFAKIDEHVVVQGIPINKWMHIALVASANNFDVYINGSLKNRIVLKSPIKQNYGDIFFNQNGGFSGYLSNVNYYAYATPYLSIQQHIKNGVSQKACVDTGEAPPYFDQRWFY